MKNLIMINPSPDWSRLMSKFNEFGLETKIVMTTQRYYDEMNSKSIFLDIQKLSDGEDILEIDQNNSSSYFIENYNFFTEKYDTIFNLINRNLFLRKKSFNDKRIYIHNLINYLHEIILKYGIDYYLFTVTPHQLSTYLIYLIALNKKKSIVLLNPTTIKGLYTISNRINSSQTLKTFVPDSEKKLIKNLLQNFYDTISNKAVNPISNSAYEQRHKSLIVYFKQIILRLKIKFEISKRDRVRFNVFFSVYLRLKRSFKISNLKKYYRKISIVPDLNASYIYFPLHYQPERTTLPEGGIYDDQFLAIKELTTFNKKGHMIYVKEHPDTFFKKLSYLSRSRSFYDELNKLDNVSLINFKYDTFSLIDNAKMIVSVNGTAVLQAHLRGKKSFYLGYPWFRNIQSISNIKQGLDFNMGLKNDTESEEKYTHSSLMDLSDYLILGYVYLNRLDFKPKDFFEISEIEEDTLAYNILKYFGLDQ